MPDIFINTQRPVDRSIVAGINQPQREAPAGAFVAGSSYDINLYFVLNDGTYDSRSGGGTTDVQLAVGTIATPQSGSFTLTDGTDTATIEYGASAQAVEDALNALNSDTGPNVGTASLVDVEKQSDTQYTITWRTLGAMTALSGASVSLHPESTPSASIAVAGSSTTYAQQVIEVTRQPAIYEQTWAAITNGHSATVAFNTTRLLQSMVLEQGQPFWLEIKLDGETVCREVVSVEESNMPASAFSGTAIKNLLDEFAADPTSNSYFDAAVWSNLLSIAAGSGDVVGPSSAVDSNFASFDTTTGKLIKDSGSNATDFATSEQGTLADSALQSADIDTLAELNAIITDATLIDTTDSRLSDARTPTPHTHTASEVTDFDTEVSNNTDVAANTADRHDAASIAASGGLDYVTISGTQQLTLHPVDLTADVSGDLPVADGGTGASDAATARTNLGVDAAGTDNSTATLGFACSDETSALAVGQAIAIDMPHDMTVTTVYASLATAGATSSITVDVEDEGTSILSSVLTLTAGSENTETSTFTGAASSYALSKGDKLTIDIDSIDDGTGAGLKVVLLGSI